MGNRSTRKKSFKFSIEKTKGKSTHAFIFIHDIGFDKRFWFPIMTDIGSNVRAIAYDLDGFGENATAALAPHTMEHHVDNLCEVIHRTKEKKPILVGVRFGAHVALQAVKREPDMCGGLFFGGVLPYAPTYDEYCEISELIADIGHKRDSAIYADYLIKTLNIDREHSSQLHYQIRNSNAENVAATLTASLTRTSTLQALRDFRHPICMLVGRDQDERIQKECINISFNKQDMSVVRVPESTTLYNLENPKAFRSALSRFIDIFEKA